MKDLIVKLNEVRLIVPDLLEELLKIFSDWHGECHHLGLNAEAVGPCKLHMRRG